MIEKLTLEQEALIPVVRDEWIKFALGGDDSLDQIAARDGILWMYEMAKLKKPMVIFVDGPMACQYAVHMIRESLKIGGEQVRDQVRAQVGEQVWAQVRAQVWAQVWAQVGEQV